MFRLAGHHAKRCFEFLCCLRAELVGPVTESAIYIAATGNFWVASCAQDLCGYFGKHIQDY